MGRKKKQKVKKIRVDAKNRMKTWRAVQSLIEQRRRAVEEEFNENYFDESIEIPTDIAIADDISLKQLLRSWVNCHGITTRAVNDLLKILKRTGIVMVFNLSRAGWNISTFF